MRSRHLLPFIHRPYVIQAPMAGGITTPTLVAAVSNNGALGSFATGYLKKHEIKNGIHAIKALTQNPFSVNVFIANQPTYDQDQLLRYQCQLNIFRRALNLVEQENIPPSLLLEDTVEDTVEIVIAEKVPVFSFTFGRLPQKLLRILKENRVYVIGTATTPEEAQMLEMDGVDAIVAQGYEAGGHRGSFLPGAEQTNYTTQNLVLSCVKSTEKTPIIAAGGIMTGDDIFLMMTQGASAVQMGTAFLTTKESGANQTYQSQLILNSATEHDPTTLTNTYSGKFARGLQTEFVKKMQELGEIPPYPAPHIMSAPIRKAAAEQNQPKFMSHWCGQGIKQITQGLTVRELIEKLTREFDKTSGKSPPSQDAGDAQNPETRYELSKDDRDTSPDQRLNFRNIIKKNKNLLICSISVSNGALYYAIAIEGGANLLARFNIGVEAIQMVSVVSSLVYTMFTYKTLESLTLKPRSLAEIGFSILAPFSAVAFLTAGISGAQLLGFSAPTAYWFGISLFFLRMVNCIDASVKFPQRLRETKSSWIQAFQQRDIAEITRLLLVWSASIAYAVCTTDAIYNSMQILSSSMNISEDVSNQIGIASAILGSIGTLPLNVYWSHRGLRQLTHGGRPAPDGSIQDPTDSYTYIGLLFVMPVTLGILGGATATTGQMFGQYGEFSNTIRLASSLLYAIFAGTPGIASLLRTAATKTKAAKQQNQSKATPAMSKNRYSYFIEREKPLLDSIKNYFLGDVALQNTKRLSK